MNRITLSIALFVLSALIGLSYGSPSPVAANPPPGRALQPEAAATPARYNQLRRSANWLVDTRGRVVILHGFNMVWKNAPYIPADNAAGFTADDADWLAEHGFNAVRLGVLFAGVMPTRQKIDAAYLAKVDRIVRLLADRGIYVLLDFHQDLFAARYQGEGFPDWATQPVQMDKLTHAGFPFNYFAAPVGDAFDRLWNNADRLQDAYRDAWSAVAARWSAQDHLMGYDLLNEPWPGTRWPLCAEAAGCARFEQVKLQALYTHVVDGIRGADDHNIVWLEPQVLFDFGAASHLGEEPVADRQLGLSWHDYCLPKTVLQAAGLKGMPARCTALEQHVFTNAGAASARLGSASLMSEFGASDDTFDIARVAELADQNAVGWMYWSYKDWGDPTTQANGTRAQGMFANDADLRSVKAQKLAALERPYPQAIAGVPLQYGYDAVGNTFTLLYSTRLADGSGAAPAGLATAVYVPTLHYPGGYRVMIAGGHAVSAANAAQLLIVADADATQVSVRLSPETMRRAALRGATETAQIRE